MAGEAEAPESTPVDGVPADGPDVDVPADDAAGGQPGDVSFAEAGDGPAGEAAAAVGLPPEAGAQACDLLGGPTASDAAELTGAGMPELEAALQAYLAPLEGTYGVHMIDLTTGATVSVNADLPFIAASTFKVPFAMFMLDLVKEGAASLQEPVTYQPEDWEEGSGVIQFDVLEGDCYTVEELLDLMLTQSDNIATNMLLRRFGVGNAFAYMEMLGGTVTHLENGRRATTPRDMANYLARAFETAQAGEPLYRTLIDWLEHTAFSDRIAAGAPEGVRVAHKIGTLPGMIHDVGVVQLPSRPFVLAIFSVDVDEEEAAVRLAEITSLVCQFLSAGAGQ